MKLLGLPYEEIDKSPLVLVDDDLLIDLEIEEEILYKKTIFRYKSQENIHENPKLGISFIAFLNPT